MSGQWVHLLAAFLVLLGATCVAKPIPAESKAAAFQVSPSLQRIAANTSPPAKWHPLIFSDRLAAVLKDNTLTPYQQVEMFIHLQREMDNCFEGIIPIPEGRTYVQFQRRMSSFDVIVSNHEALKGRDPGALLAIATDNVSSSTLLSSNALLMAAMFDQAKTGPVVVKLLAPESVAKSQCAPIALHYYGRVARLCWNPEIEAALIALVKTRTSEEELEDVLFALGGHKGGAAEETLVNFMKLADRPADNAFEMAGHLIMHLNKGESWPATAAELAAALPTEEKKKAFEQLQKEVVEPGPGGTFFKTWDGMDQALYDDGFIITMPGSTFTGIMLKPE